MKIGIISDIHGGLRELISALTFLKDASVDQVICAGDLVDYGQQGDEVVQQINAAQIPCVGGNHDQYARENQRKHLANRLTPPLQPKTVDVLDRLPQMIRFEWVGRTALLTHATSWGGEMYIYPESTPPLFRRVVREAKAEIVILGHTHRPMWVEIENGTILNPGSLSLNYLLGFGTYGILAVPTRQFQVFNVETGEPVDLVRQTY